MGLSVSPVNLQQFINKCSNTSQMENDTQSLWMILWFSQERKKHSEDLENLFEALIKFKLNIVAHKCQYFRDQ